MKKKVLIADYQCWDSLMDVPRMFKAAGCEIHLYCRGRSWLPKGKYHEKLIPAPEDERAYIEGLAGLAPSYALVVPGDDLTGLLAAQALDKAAFERTVPLCRFEDRELLGSKAGLSRACSRHGISTPPYAVSVPGKSVMESAAGLTFPVLLKADRSAGGAGVFFCADAEALSRAFAALAPEDRCELVVQEYVRGENLAVEAFFSRGRLVTHAQSVVTKTVSGEFGVSSERRYVSRPEVLAFVSRIGQAFDLNGFASMTIMHDGQRYYLVEADLRPQAWYSLAKIDGTDFGQAVRDSLSGTVAPVPRTRSAGKVIRHFPRDLLWCAEHRDYAGLLKWCYGADGRWRAVPWHMPRVIATVLYRGGKHFARKARAKLLRS